MPIAPTLWNAVDAAAATGGRSRRYWEANGVAIDSRNLAPGDLFIALQTDNRDGHDFVADALQNGASAAMVVYPPKNVAEDAPLLFVDDTMSGLERLGMFARSRSTARRIAITGSVGKTGTKEALKACLSAIGVTHASAASYNNQWGVPLTLARLPQDTAFGIFEIGMNHAGEIAALSPQVAPELAIITTIAPAHLAFFNSTEDIARAKAEIFLGVSEGGRAIIHGDAPHASLLVKLAQERNLEVVTFGRASHNDCTLENVERRDDRSFVTASFLGQSCQYQLGPAGDHWVDNSLAILAALTLLELPLTTSLAPLAKLQAGVGRGAVQRLPFNGGELAVIDESYNANPTSMAAAIRVLGQGQGRKVAILGDMLELGPNAPAMHADLAAVIEEQAIDLVITCGTLMAMLNAAVPAFRRGAHSKDSTSLADQLGDYLDAGDIVLVKGSLGSRMQIVLQAIDKLAAHRTGSAA